MAELVTLIEYLLMIPFLLSAGGGDQRSVKEFDDCEMTLSPTGAAEGTVHGIAKIKSKQM